jgi:hypothetical protein
MAAMSPQALPDPFDIAPRKLAAGEELRRTTERLRALGVDDEVVFSGTADGAIATLDAIEPGPCASST